MCKPRLIKAAYFVWVIVPVSLWLFFTINGSLGFKWSYSWNGNGNNNPWATRYYTRCDYIVWGYGKKRFIPLHGKCPVFKLFKV